jgi:hypothetical protein
MPSCFTRPKREGISPVEGKEFGRRKRPFLKSYQHFLLGDFEVFEKFLEEDIANRSCLFGENKGLFLRL